VCGIKPLTFLLSVVSRYGALRQEPRFDLGPFHDLRNPVVLQNGFRQVCSPRPEELPIGVFLQHRCSTHVGCFSPEVYFEVWERCESNVWGHAAATDDVRSSVLVWVKPLSDEINIRCQKAIWDTAKERKRIDSKAGKWNDATKQRSLILMPGAYWSSRWETYLALNAVKPRNSHFRRSYIDLCVRSSAKFMKL
jgi:hypothetical protein